MRAATADGDDGWVAQAGGVLLGASLRERGGDAREQASTFLDEWRADNGGVDADYADKRLADGPDGRHVDLVGIADRENAAEEGGYDDEYTSCEPQRVYDFS